MEISHIEDILINGSKNFKNKIACMSLNNQKITYAELYLKSKNLADFFVKSLFICKIFFKSRETVFFYCRPDLFHQAHIMPDVVDRV